MVAVRVVRDRQLAVEAAGLVEEGLGLGGVEGAELATGPGLVAGDAGGDPAVGRAARAVELVVDDLLPVDRHRDRLAQLRVRVVRGDLVGGDRHGLDRTVGLLRPAVGQVALVLLGDHRAGGHLVDDVEVAGEEVVVRRVLVLVDAERDLVDLTAELAVVVGVLLQDGLATLLVGGHLVGAGADRLVTEGLRVREEGLRLRGEGGVAQAHLEVGDRLGRLDLERGVVDDLEAGHLVGLGLGGLQRAVLAVRVVGLQVLEAGDRLEEVGQVLAVRGVGGVVPRVDEALGRDRRAVGELAVLLQLHGEGLVVRALDGLREVGLGLGGVRVVTEEGRGEELDDVVTAGLTGVAADERVLGLAPTDDDLAACLAGLGRIARRTASTGAVATPAAAAGEQHGGRRHAGDECSARNPSHGCLLHLSAQPLCGRFGTAGAGAAQARSR